MHRFRKIHRIYATGMSVDWIVLTASCVGLAVVILASITAGDGGAAAQVASFFIGADLP